MKHNKLEIMIELILGIDMNRWLVLLEQRLRLFLVDMKKKFVSWIILFIETS